MRISLQELMCHEWVTREGSDPLLSMEHKRLRLAETSVDQGACESLKFGRMLTVMDPLDIDTIETTAYSPAPLPSRRALDRRPSTDVYSSRRRTSICSSDLTEMKRYAFVIPFRSMQTRLGCRRTNLSAAQVTCLDACCTKGSNSNCGCPSFDSFLCITLLLRVSVGGDLANLFVFC